MANNRRGFISNTAKIIAASAIQGFVNPVQKQTTSKEIAAGDKIVLGLIGARGQGMADLRQALKQPGVECAAVCDVDDAVLTERT
ncbi:MAG: gfo/Idh/MocA family oxidoreductase, partial [Ginsengibacter sp.]